MSTSSIHKRFTLSATERLQLRKQIETLFQSGKAFSISSLRVVYTLNNRTEKEISPVRIGFSIPKKRIKLAVNRNRIRRVIKEAWRLQKLDIYPLIPQDKQIHLFLIYKGKEKFTFTEAQESIEQIITKLKEKIKMEQ